jgi:hypothetical protein
VKLEPGGLIILSLEYRTASVRRPSASMPPIVALFCVERASQYLTRSSLTRSRRLNLIPSKDATRGQRPGGSRYQPPASGVERASFKDSHLTLASPIVVFGFVASSAFNGCISVSIV